jgi:hypothetical protein
MLVNTPIYLPPFIRERAVRNYILEQRQPKILFTKPGGDNVLSAVVIKAPIEWSAH